MQKIKPSKYFCWVVHLDGMRDTHDYWVERKGTWNKAIQALQRAIDAGLFLHLNVFDNVTLVARLDGWSADELNARFKQLLQMVGLSADLRDRHPHELSGGQQQRVGLCRAFMMRPDLLLLDEPFSAVDPLTRADIHREFASMQRLEATSAVMVTHDMGEAVKLASYLVIVHAGRIVRKGQTATVTQNPGDPRVARLFEGLA